VERERKEREKAVQLLGNKTTNSKEQENLENRGRYNNSYSSYHGGKLRTVDQKTNTSGRRPYERGGARLRDDY